MAPSIWEVFLARLSGGEDSDSEDDGSRFVPSPLDLSVRVGHGGQDGTAARELRKIRERAREIDDHRRES